LPTSCYADDKKDKLAAEAFLKLAFGKLNSLSGSEVIVAGSVTPGIKRANAANGGGVPRQFRSS
jgi:hypothetical protein